MVSLGVIRTQIIPGRCFNKKNIAEQVNLFAEREKSKAMQAYHKISAVHPQNQDIYLQNSIFYSGVVMVAGNRV